MSLGAVGAHDRPNMHGGLGGAKKREPSRWGLVFPGECATRLAEGGGESNGGGYNKFGCSWCTHSSDCARGTRWCRKARTKSPGLCFSWEMQNEAGRAWRGVH